MSFYSLRRACIFGLALSNPGAAMAPKSHVITFGKWNIVQYRNESKDKPVALKVRPLMVDGRVKEFTMSAVHDVTDRLFVVQRVFRVNDSLPDEPVAHWQWQVGAWLLVDRVTGHVSALNFPDFDAISSTASWYRDYAAYCGISDEGKKVYAVVAEIGHRKPLLKKLLLESEPGKEEAAAQPCPTPSWDRSPTRVTFLSGATARQTFAIRGHAVDPIPETQDEEDEAAR